MNDTIRAALVNVIKANRMKMSRAQRSRGVKTQRWLYPLATEMRYGASIRAWLRPMKEYVHNYIKENHEEILRGDGADFRADSADDISVTRLDAVPGKKFKTMIDSLNGWLGQYVPEDNESVSGSAIYMGLGKIADSVFDFNEGQYEKGAKSVLGVEFPVGEDWWPDARDTWANNNYKIIRSDMQKYISQINDLVEKAVTTGQSVKTLSEQIQKLDNNISKARANFIARDQIGKLNGTITQMRMESIGLTMYVWETAGDERVRGDPNGKYRDALPSHYLMDMKLCRWSDATVYSEDGGKTWIDRPSGAVQLHPEMDFQCRCSATAYWQELVGEADAQIDLLSENTYNMQTPNIEGQRVMPPQPASSNNINAQNKTATANFVKNEYPDEKFVSDVSQLKNQNKYTKGLVIPKGVKVAESRMPRSTKQRETLRKELRQASILAKKGNTVYLIPEHGDYGETFKDAVVNGVLYEFREITGKARTLEWEFGDAKERKGNDTNMFISIESNISKNEARRRIGMVLERHPEYTGKIVVSFNALTAEEKIYFWDTTDFR